MILHYIKKKENYQKKISKKIYSKIILQIKKIVNIDYFNFKKEFDTSFELTVFHVFIIFFSYSNEEKKITQEIMNLFIQDLDYSFRQKGISDTSIGKYVKKHVKKFYYRLQKLDKIFNKEDIEDFIKYNNNIDILNDKINKNDYYKYIFKYITININHAKSVKICNFTFQNLKYKNVLQ